MNFYAFYPFSLIRAAIAKVGMKKCSGIIIIPWWKTVLVSHDGIITEKFPDTSFSNHTDFTIQKIRKTPTLSINEIIRYSLIRENSRSTNISREIIDVVTDSWRTTTQSQYKSVLDGLFMQVHISLTPDVNTVLSFIHGIYVHKWLFI